ncbi:hypothetical protein AKO1_006564, partial [Acrasis kona]
MIYWDQKTINANACDINLAISVNPEGPFQIQNPIRLHSCNAFGSTAGLWVDRETNKAYIRHNHHNNRHRVEQLSDDWMSGSDMYDIHITNSHFISWGDVL